MLDRLCQGCIKIDTFFINSSKTTQKGCLSQIYIKRYEKVIRTHVISDDSSLCQFVIPQIHFESELRGNGVRHQKRQQRTEPKHTVDGWNPTRKPVEVGSWSPIICKTLFRSHVVGKGISEPSTVAPVGRSRKLRVMARWPDGQGYGRILEIETQKISGWRFQICFMFTPNPREMESNLTFAHVSNGVVQPPTTVDLVVRFCRGSVEKCCLLWNHGLKEQQRTGA